MWCVLSRKDGLGDASKGRTTVYNCSKFKVPLCLSVPTNLRKNCWYVWQMTQTLRPRQIGTVGPRLGGPSSQTMKMTVRAHNKNSIHRSNVGLPERNVCDFINLAQFTSASVQDGAPSDEGNEVQGDTGGSRRTRRHIRE